MRVPLAPWLWPLLPPAGLALGAVLLALGLLWATFPPRPGDVPQALLISAALLLATLVGVLIPPAVVLLVLRRRAGRDGRVYPRLWAFRGLCAGLSVTVLLGALVVLYGLAPVGNPALLLALSPVLPALGYALGHLVAHAPKT